MQRVGDRVVSFVYARDVEPSLVIPGRSRILRALSVAIKGVWWQERRWVAGEGNVERGGEGGGRRACRRDSSPRVTGICWSEK